MKRETLDEYKRTGRYVRTAMYLRKSREEQGMNTEETLRKHRTLLDAYAEKAGLQIGPDDIYQEVVSGESLFARPQMLSLLEAVSNGRYEAVLCIDMQRLGRGGMYDQGLILDTFKFSETLIITPERLYDLTKELDEQSAEMETFLSRGEYRLITKRLRRGLMQVINSGAYAANTPYGYERCRIDKLPSLKIIPKEAEIVRQIFEMYASGMGCTIIEQRVNALGAHGRRGARFNRNTIRIILDNPVYIGKIRWNRTSTVKSGVGPSRKKKVVYNSSDQWILIDGRHPPIISQELWDAVRAEREKNYFYVDNKVVASPLASLVFCSNCGRKMNMMGQRKGVAYLLCPTPGCCAGAKFDYVEQAVLRQLVELSHNLEIRVSSQVPPDTSHLEQILTKSKEQLPRIEDRRNRLYSLLEDGTYSRAVFSERMQVLAQEEDQLKASIASLEEEIHITQSRNEEKQLSQLKTVLERYQSASVSGKKELLHSVISQVIYTKKKKTKPADFHLDITLCDFF
ncbi:recombinase family protein [Oscillibacter sp.]|uniref:recombinase family protein n=1 Tax=Oscillibacter sp. TaxID=1945593 RepID=UPI0028B041D3|nr:recombinase family protein [Oscillibacter sp.]